MFKFDNTHIFTGYLKQKLSSVNIPTCKIYTNEFVRYLEEHGQEDPRIVESYDTIVYDANEKLLATRINYLKNNELYNYYVDRSKPNSVKRTWKRVNSMVYDSEITVPGLTKTLYSPGHSYDTRTHEYLGEYLRFLRDYHNVNLMSLYNCFNNTICNNLNIRYPTSENDKEIATFNSKDTKYKIYAIPVKLFSKYTIAIDCNQGFEIICGLYNTHSYTLDTTPEKLKTNKLYAKTYQRVSRAVFNQPILYDKLAVDKWSYMDELVIDEIESTVTKTRINTDALSRCDILNKEQDLKMFIKIPTSCKSSVVILEGDFRSFNNNKYDLLDGEWHYQQNHALVNFDSTDNKVLNNGGFVPIGKLQLLAFNTGESYPFADRLVEYLSDSVITPLEEIPDNIKRVQKVMSQNHHYFKIDGVWENKIQKIIYDYIINSGPIKIVDGKLQDTRRGYHKRLGHTSKSTLYDILGYVDKDAEKWYASWVNKNNEADIQDTIQNVDIYVDKNGKHLYEDF